jgi:group I intron endonuclease
MANFSLIILEYTSSENLISCEQKWIDLLNPEYNLKPTAGNSLGFKHSEGSLNKIREAALGRKYSEDVKRAMSESRKGENNAFYGKIHTFSSLDLIRKAALNRTNPPVPGIEVEIIDLDTNEVTVYDSIRKAANSIGSGIKNILRHP